MLGQNWGPGIHLGKLRDPLSLPPEKVHINFLHIMAGVGNGANKVMLMRESLAVTLSCGIG